MIGQTTRKAQGVGSNMSLNITLPKDWMKQYALEKQGLLGIVYDDLCIVFPANRADLETKAKALLKK